MTQLLPKGSIVGDYTIEEILGRGGMGAVYKARSSSGEHVALKMLSTEDEEDLVFRERFKREAAAAALIAHEGVVRALGAGEHGKGLWIAFELVGGGSLADKLKLGPLPWRDATRLCAEVARALAAIHDAGVIHRDLKPGNVLLDEEGHARLTDFGIARSATSSGHSLTRTGELIGTAEYVSPEQIDTARKVDARADLYSLGIMLHALIAGSPPFTGNSFTVLRAHLNDRPPALARRVPVPAVLDALVGRLLEKDPAHRPGSAREVAAELETIATSAGSRRGLVATAIVAFVLVVGAALAVLLRPVPPAPPQPPPHGPPPPPPAPTGPPAWYAALAASERPHLPLPAGVAFGKNKETYVALVDSSVELVFVPGGKFPMGEENNQDSNRAPIHDVEVSSFFMAKYEATIGQFRRFASTLTRPLPRQHWGYFHRTPSRSHDDPLWEKDNPRPIQLEEFKAQDYFKDRGLTWDRPYNPDDIKDGVYVTDRHPVTEVTAHDAMAYAKWLGLDLPTEAQWEYAASWDRKNATHLERFTWGDDVPSRESGKLANLIDLTLITTKSKQSQVYNDYDDGYAFAAPVGSFPRDRSPAGIFDLMGNVREICRDLYDERFYDKPESRVKDPLCRVGNEEDGVHTIRGGSWAWHGGERGGTLSVATRDPMNYASNCIGFRVAIEAP
ncbi:MAG TPA: bifunctional serine/threonine-protein kinase/formylglycine-generating enzyme family protein [Planctomycetota bacterium]|nr:bifunctional serine/threonine-protein kinase/formylglycine-generating enzyme family protein [Planctomycetota bacterium]